MSGGGPGQDEEHALLVRDAVPSLAGLQLGPGGLGAARGDARPVRGGRPPCAAPPADLRAVRAWLADPSGAAAAPLAERSAAATGLRGQPHAESCARWGQPPAWSAHERAPGSLHAATRDRARAQAAAAEALRALLAEGGAAAGGLRVRAAPYVDAAVSAAGTYGEAAAAQARTPMILQRVTLESVDISKG